MWLAVAAVVIQEIPNMAVVAVALVAYLQLLQQLFLPLIIL
jgi:hypothetical protein